MKKVGKLAYRMIPLPISQPFLAKMDGRSTCLLAISTSIAKGDGRMLEICARVLVLTWLRLPVGMYTISSSVLEHISLLTRGLVCGSRQRQVILYGQMDHQLVNLLSGPRGNLVQEKMSASK